MQLYFQVLFGVILGVTLGHFAPDFAVLFKPMGDAFIKIVKMMIVPVVFCTIVIGIATVGGNQSIGKTLLKAMALFYVLTIIALATGLVAVETIKPGAGMHIAASSIDPSEAARYAKNAKPLDFIDVLLHIIPQSFFTPFAEGEVLPVLFISIITGFGLRRAGKAGQPFLGGLESFSAALFAAFGFLMKLAPFGAFGAIAFIIAKNGIKSVGNLGLLIVTFYVASIFFVFVVLATAGAISRVQSVEAASLYQGRTAGCSRHVVDGTSPAGDALQAGEAWLQQGLGGSDAPARILVQSRWYGDLSDAGFGVPGPGDGYPAHAVADPLDDLRDAADIKRRCGRDRERFRSAGRDVGGDAGYRSGGGRRHHRRN